MDPTSIRQHKHILSNGNGLLFHMT